MDEGASTFITSMYCWKAIGSPHMSQLTTTLKAFDGRTYKLCGILNSLQVELRGKVVSTEVEVIDKTLDYNLLLGRTWVYAMAANVSTYFRMITFPHKGRIVAIDQLTFFHL